MSLYSVISSAASSLVFNVSNSWLIAIIVNTFLIAIAAIIPKKLLTGTGLIHAWILGVIIWGTLSWQGYLVIIFYFLVGSGVTRIGIGEKEAQGIAEKRSGVRGPENVWGSASTAAICAIGSLFLDSPFNSLLLLGYTASLSTKLADTCASEIGKAYGKTTFLITNFQPVAKGTEGAISLEGTLAGIMGSIAIALVGWAVNLISLTGIIWCIIAAFIATNIESLIGATLQDKYDWLTNELVNVINTLIGAIIAILLGYFLVI